MTETITGGAGPDRPPRPRRWRSRSVRFRHPRAVVGTAVLVLAVAVVGISRAALPEPVPVPAPSTAARPAVGTIHQIAAGDDTLYVLLETCAAEGRECGTRLVASADDGRTWQRRSLPPSARQSDLRLRVVGPDEQVLVEDVAAGTIDRSTDGGLNWRTLLVTEGPPIPRIPLDQERHARLCAGQPRCPVAGVEWVSPDRAVRHRLAVQPPFPPTVFATGPVMWAAGIDPRTKVFTVAASIDLGASWQLVPLPGARIADATPTLVPGRPGRTPVHLLLRQRGTEPYEIWTVPYPDGTGMVPHRAVVPAEAVLDTDGGITLPDGSLLLNGPTLIGQDGSVRPERRALVDPAGYVFGIGRGPGPRLHGSVQRSGGVPAIALADPDDPLDWTFREIPA